MALLFLLVQALAAGDYREPGMDSGSTNTSAGCNHIFKCPKEETRRQQCFLHVVKVSIVSQSFISALCVWHTLSHVFLIGHCKQKGFKALEQ